MASVRIDSVNRRVTSANEVAIPASRHLANVFVGTRSIVLALTVMIFCGLGLRLIGLGSIGFAEDEINKVEAVRAYDRGDFTANAEHPMLMKVLMDLSMRAARAWNSVSSRHISEEAALRFPNVLFGALSGIPLFLLSVVLFERRVALLAAAFWSFGINAVTYNRIGKEDTLMVFFMLFAFYFFIWAKQAMDQEWVKRSRNLSAISFGLMMAAKYFPHYFGLNMLYHHFYKMRARLPDEPSWVTPLSFFLLMGVAFVIANPAILSPSVWNYLNAYSGEKLLTHTGYLMGNHLYKNTVSSSPFWGLPLYFYFLFLAIKIPLAILGTLLIGTLVSVRRWREPGYGFVLFMLFFWLIPYSLFAAKWLRYTLSLMPFVYMASAIGVMAIIRWLTMMFEKFNVKQIFSQLATAVLLLAVLVLPAWTTYASAPHFALYTNTLGRGYAAYFFPHDEFYDDGLSEAIEFVCRHASGGATIVSETPGAVRYYSEKFERRDLQSRVLSDPKFEIDNNQPAYYFLERGRTYFENQDKMKHVREQFTLVYAGCVHGHTAVEVYVSGPSTNSVQPCGDLRP